jgi:UDP-GlcNAc:undecaprenyl-phosphate/decaprenyl-phosphate GlcNAc-1-phosphate transferase
MLEIILIFILGFVLNLAFTPISRSLALKVGLVDRPDGRRKLQTDAIPVAGGPAVLVSVTAAVGLALATAGWFGLTVNFRPEVLLGLLAAAAIICVVGVVDDFIGLRGRYKLLGQCIAVGVVIGCGVQIKRVHFFDLEFDLGVLSVPLTMFLLLGAINSLNLLDGMDGLLGSVGLIVCATFGTMAMVCSQAAAAWVAFALAGALLAFLQYNFPPATVYMGDSGSMLVGLVVGVLAIHGSMKGPATIALIAPMCVLVIPIFDTAAAITRRKLVGRSIFSTDRGHLHHCLLRSGLSRRKALLVVSAMSIVGMAGGIISITQRSEAAAAIAAAAIVLTLIVSRLFGYNEVRLILQRLRYLSRVVLRAQSDDGQTVLAIQIQGTINWQPVWNRLLAGSELLQFHQVRLDIEDPSIGESFHARVNRGTGVRSEVSREFKIVFPLETGGRVIGKVEVISERVLVPLAITVGKLTDLVHEMERVAAELIAGTHEPQPADTASPRLATPPQTADELTPVGGVA